MAGSEVVNVVQIGVGPIGQAIVRQVSRLPGVHLVGAVDPAPDKAGRDVGELCGLGPLGVDVAPSIQAAHLDAAAVALHSTFSHLEQVQGQIATLVEAGLDVISTCEELSWPWYHHAAPARAIDQEARRAGVTVLGTGVNPGFVMDLLPLVMSTVSLRVDRVYVLRVVDASKRRGPLQRKIGSGLSPARFREEVEAGRMGHVGLPESAALVAAGLGWRLDAVDQAIEPVISDRPIETSYVHVEPGQVQGIYQVVRAVAEGRERVRLELIMALDPGQHGAADGSIDRLRIEGEPPLEVTVPGGVFGDSATVAAVVNAIPRVIEAPPGLLSVKDIPVAACWPAKL